MLALSAVLAICLIVVFMLSNGISWRLGGVRVRVSDAWTALAVAAACSAGVLVSAWRVKTLKITGMALLAVCGLLALVAVARGAEQFAPTGDLAIIESNTLEALRGRMLLGPYSRFGWHHPGPIYFYLLAPFYALSDYRTAGLAAGAVAINITSVAAMAWVIFRRRAEFLAIAVTLASVLFLWRFSDMAASAWNPHVLVLPTLALVVTCAAIASGAGRLLPLAAVLASFVVQTHVGLVPTVLVASGIAALVAVGGTLLLGDRAERGRMWMFVAMTTAVLFVLWFLPLVEEVTRTPGNMTEIWRFFERTTGGQPFDTAFEAWSDALTGAFRPDFSTAWGGPLKLAAGGWVGPVAVAQIAFLLSAAIIWRRRRFAASLAAMLAVASLLALVSTMRIPGQIVDHELFWMAALGMVNTAVLTEAGISALSGAEPLKVPRAAAIVGCVSLCLAAAAASLPRLQMVVDHSFRPSAAERGADGLSRAIIERVRPDPRAKALIRIDPRVWEVGAGVVVQLQKADVPFGLEPRAARLFADVLKATGTETGAVYIESATLHVQLEGQPGVVPLAQSAGYLADIVPIAAGPGP